MSRISSLPLVTNDIISSYSQVSPPHTFSRYSRRQEWPGTREGKGEEERSGKYTKQRWLRPRSPASRGLRSPSFLSRGAPGDAASPPRHGRQPDEKRDGRAKGQRPPYNPSVAKAQSTLTPFGPRSPVRRASSQPGLAFHIWHPSRECQPFCTLKSHLSGRRDTIFFVVRPIIPAGHSGLPRSSTREEMSQWARGERGTASAGRISQ